MNNGKVTRVDRTRMHYTVSQIVYAIRTGSIVLPNGLPCSQTVTNILMDLSMPSLVLHRELKTKTGDMVLYPISGISRLVAIWDESKRLLEKTSKLEDSDSITSEVNRFWLYSFDLDVLGGSWNEALNTAGLIEKAKTEHI